MSESDLASCHHMLTTAHIGEYIQDALYWKFNPHFPITQPNGLKGDLLHDSHHILQTVQTAFETIGESFLRNIASCFNQYIVRMPWSIVDYTKCLTQSQNMGRPEREAALLQQFPPHPSHANGTRLIRDPCIVVDAADRIIVWYLPDALTQKRHVSWPLLVVACLIFNKTRRISLWNSYGP